MNVEFGCARVSRPASTLATTSRTGWRTGACASLASFASFAFVAFLGACSDGSSRPPVLPGDTAGSGGPTGGLGGSGTSSSSDGGSRSDGGDGGSCTSLDNIGVAVNQSAVPSDAPVLGGGTISEGLYRLTESSIYTGLAGGQAGLTGVILRETLLLSGGAFELVSERNGTAQPRVSGNYAVTAGQLSLQVTCPAGQGIRNFTFTAATSTLSLRPLTTNEVLIYQKVP